MRVITTFHWSCITILKLHMKISFYNMPFRQLFFMEKSAISNFASMQSCVSLTSQNLRPLTELPRESRGGDQVQMPMTLGMTSMMAPHTPDLAGSPTCYRASLSGVASIFIGSKAKPELLNQSSFFMSL